MNDTAYNNFIEITKEKIELTKEELNKILIEESKIKLMDKEINEFLERLSEDTLKSSDEFIIWLCIKKVIISKDENEIKLSIVPKF